MVIPSGSKLLIVHRRLFEADESRFFIGIVERTEDGIAKVSGYTWTRDIFTGMFRRKEDRRTKLIALSSGALIIYEIESTADLEAIRFELTPEGRFMVGDGKRFRMDLTEHPARPNLV